ncbi:MAG TPA: aromatic ring-hydroxylating dioxygenase subunit alpha [Candidatus Lustribacter sp.]|nr:aromatic ring-hydroxylating dioxygenase subunit alpha [Candidatus Lustribacter sp.]
MLTVEENERLTRVGPGTPMGTLMRRYWQPIGAASEMRERWTKPVRLLGESLVLYRDRGGGFGLIGESCPHRRASLLYGIPERDGIRCPYHGWKFDGTGACLDQPNQPPESTFKDKIRIPAYPVEERGGLLWAYLGPLPAPRVAPLAGLDAPHAIRLLGSAVIPCNWLQIMENSVDAIHTEWLHGHLFEFVLEHRNFKTNFTRKHIKTAFDEFPYGIIKRRVVEGFTEESDDWKIGHPLVFPATLLVGSASDTFCHMRYQLRVPIDDTNTLHLWYHVIVAPDDTPIPAHLAAGVTTYDVPYLDEHGNYILELVHAQDIMAWVTQGPIADRSIESLGTTDRGVTAYRNMLRRELKRVESGEDPMNVFRAAGPETMELPLEHVRGQRDLDPSVDALRAMFTRHEARFCPIGDEVIAVFSEPRREPVPA